VNIYLKGQMPLNDVYGPLSVTSAISAISRNFRRPSAIFTDFDDRPRFSPISTIRTDMPRYCGESPGSLFSLEIADQA